MKFVFPLIAAACAALYHTVTAAPPALAQTNTPPAAAAGAKPVALSVTGYSEVLVAPASFTLAISFYDDAVGPEAAQKKNEETETKLRQAALNAGAKPGDITTSLSRQVGYALPRGVANGSALDGIQNPALVLAAAKMNDSEPARAGTHLLIRGNSVKTLKPMLAALQKVEAHASFYVAYQYPASVRPATRNDLKKKAVADAAEQARMWAEAAGFRKLQLIGIEPGKFSQRWIGQSLSYFPVTAENTAPVSMESLPRAAASQFVTLHYAFADAPDAAPKNPALTPAKTTVKKR